MRNYSLLQQENSLLRRSAPLRPSTVAAVRAAAPAPAPTPTPVPVRTHVIVDGDTLTKISLEYYGTAGRWQAIYEANRDTLPNESTLTIGNTLRIP
jgi:nucleoid-associated protein YgaU